MTRFTLTEGTRTYLLRVIARALDNTHQVPDELADAILAKLSNTLREMADAANEKNRRLT